MAEMVAFPIGDGEARVFVDIADDDGGVQRISRDGGVIGTATAAFEAGFSHLRDAAAHAIAQLTALPRRPSTVELEFGVRISAQAGAVLARTGADGHLKVRMVWESQDPAAGTPSQAAEGAGENTDE